MEKNSTDTNTAPEAAATATVIDPATETTPHADGPSGPVWDALTATPGTTVSAIATVTEMSRPVVRRALTALETDGHATRAPGGYKEGKRAADSWSPAKSATTPGPRTEAAEPAATESVAEETATPGTATDGATVTVTDDDTSTTGEDHISTGTPEPADTDTDDAGEGMDPAILADAVGALRALAAAITSAREALNDGDREAALSAAEAIYSGSGVTRRVIRTAAQGRPRTASGTPRSHPGELRTKVASHLAAYPGKEFTPHEVAKVIGHSAGAVANALDRLIGLGVAVETCARPRRFTAASDHTPVTA